MSAVDNLPVSSRRGHDEAGAPIVTLLGTDLPNAYLDDAEPSPLMEKAARFWNAIKRAMVAALLASAVAVYPASVYTGHKIDDREILASDTIGWHSTEVGTMLTLLGRELTGPGWVSDRASWHPQARLTALPAWQSSMAGALADYIQLLASRVRDTAGHPDADLSAAARLLVLDGESESLPSLSAAAEALQRYDGRLSRNLAPSASSSADVETRLIELTRWATGSLIELKRSANTVSGWPSSKSDIEAVYHARAKAHVAGELLKAIFQDTAIQPSRQALSARDDALYAWRRAALFGPFFITSQAKTSRILADHPATMAFYMHEAAAATETLRLTLQNRETLSADLSD